MTAKELARLIIIWCAKTAIRGYTSEDLRPVWRIDAMSMNQFLVDVGAITEAELVQLAQKSLLAEISEEISESDPKTQ